MLRSVHQLLLVVLITVHESLYPLTETIQTSSIYSFEYFHVSSTAIPADTLLDVDFSDSEITPPVGTLTTCN